MNVIESPAFGRDEKGDPPLLCSAYLAALPRDFLQFGSELSTLITWTRSSQCTWMMWYLCTVILNSLQIMKLLPYHPHVLETSLCEWFCRMVLLQLCCGVHAYDCAECWLEWHKPLQLNSWNRPSQLPASAVPPFTLTCTGYTFSQSICNPFVTTIPFVTKIPWH